MSRKLLPLAMMCLLLAGCVTTTDTAATEGVPPEAADPLADTDQTIAEVKANNRAHAGWGCPQ